MKKVLLLSTLLVALFVTGCGSKKVLDCNQTITTSGLKQIVNLNAEYSGDEITYYGLKYDMDLSAYGDTEIAQVNSQDMCSAVKANMAAYSNAFTNCKQKIENKHLIITADFDLKELKSMSSKTETIDELKKELENQNYTCTIK